MSEYKLVPVEPTLDMLSAGLEVYGLEDCAEADVFGIFKAMLAAAPAVQGEPVVFDEDAALSIAERTFNTEVGEQLANDIVQYAQRLHSLYTTPQPAEQQPAPDVAGLAASLYQACGAYDMPERILDVLSAAANGEPFEHMIDGLLPCVPPSDQDVAALVDALTELCDEIDNHDIRSAISKTNILWFKRKARAALAAHRKQGGEA